ncbi:hypothetical protein DFH07DRAFT_819649 [Mycena maculata]|uniref:Uncharacterized protein n=1 Tax=Mycena maculata TaxID=230809 RepID=A0AAD7NEA6_9AGAR|nr:hypothetical protein DFH07DRAFT_819649 [Mycena maculata]
MSTSICVLVIRSPPSIHLTSRSTASSFLPILLIVTLITRIIMTPSVSWFAALALAAPLAVYAIPSPQTLPAAGCVPLTAVDVQTIPGWSTLQSTAETEWGTGPYNVIANDPAYPAQAATNCAGTAGGWVWFEYLQVVDGHYKWALNMDDVLPNAADRQVGVNPPPAPSPSATPA